MANLRLLIIYLRSKACNSWYLHYLHMMNKVHEAGYDNNTQSLICRWMGYATSQQFREGMLIQLGMLTAWQCDRMLVDLRDMVLIGKEDQEWMDRTYLPMAVQYGLKIVGIVPSEHYFNKVAVDNIVVKIQPEIVQVRYHLSVEAAREWFVTHPSIPPGMPESPAGRSPQC